MERRDRQEERAREAIAATAQAHQRAAQKAGQTIPTADAEARVRVARLREERRNQSS